MFLAEVAERHQSFPAEQLPEPSIRMCHTSHLIHRSSQLHSPIWVESVDRALSTSAEICPFAGGPF
jgi:hypothetical protein